MWYTKPYRHAKILISSISMWRITVHPIGELMQDLIEYILGLTDKYHSWYTYMIFNNDLFITNNIQKMIYAYNIEYNSIESTGSESTGSAPSMDYEQNLEGFEMVLNM